MSIRSTSQTAASRTAAQARRPRPVEIEGPSFTEVIHARLFSNYEPPRGEVRHSA